MGAVRPAPSGSARRATRSSSASRCRRSPGRCRRRPAGRPRPRWSGPAARPRAARWRSTWRCARRRRSAARARRTRSGCRPSRRRPASARRTAKAARAQSPTDGVNDGAVGQEFAAPCPSIASAKRRRVRAEVRRLHRAGAAAGGHRQSRRGPASGPAGRRPRTRRVPRAIAWPPITPDHPGAGEEFVQRVGDGVVVDARAASRRRCRRPPWSAGTSAYARASGRRLVAPSASPRRARRGCRAGRGTGRRAGPARAGRPAPRRPAPAPTASGSIGQPRKTAPAGVGGQQRGACGPSGRRTGRGIRRAAPRRPPRRTRRATRSRRRVRRWNAVVRVMSHRPSCYVRHVPGGGGRAGPRLARRCRVLRRRVSGSAASSAISQVSGRDSTDAAAPTAQQRPRRTAAPCSRRRRGGAAAAARLRRRALPSPPARRSAASPIVQPRTRTAPSAVSGPKRARCPSRTARRRRSPRRAPRRPRRAGGRSGAPPPEHPAGQQPQGAGPHRLQQPPAQCVSPGPARARPIAVSAQPRQHAGRAGVEPARQREQRCGRRRRGSRTPRRRGPTAVSATPHGSPRVRRRRRSRRLRGPAGCPARRASRAPPPCAGRGAQRHRARRAAATGTSGQQQQGRGHRQRGAGAEQAGRRPVERQPGQVAAQMQEDQQRDHDPRVQDTAVETAASSAEPGRAEADRGQPGRGRVLGSVRATATANCTVAASGTKHHSSRSTARRSSVPGAPSA